MAQLDLRGISKSFGDTAVLRDIDLSIGDGEFLTLVGPSGCGKSTLIRIIAGLEPQTAGSIEVDGVGIDHLRPHERRVAMVFQSYALYPHMTVFQNLALPLTMARLTMAERLPLVRLLSPRRRRVMAGIGQEVGAVAEQLQIDRLLDRRPAQLSGGQRQRVALGRAMVRHPAVFLMDEPLSNLDAKLRVHMRSELADLHARLRATFVYVTHDQVEAMTMSDRVAMMHGGRIIQLGTPAQLYDHPANLTVAQFIGSPTINLIKGRIGTDGAVEIPGGRIDLATGLPAGAEVTVGLRPEAVVPAPLAPAFQDPVRLPARLHRRENLGPEQILHFDLVGAEKAGLTCRVMGNESVVADEPVDLLFEAGACHVFNAAGERVALPATPASGRPPVRSVAPLIGGTGA
ncbi:ABC transporter ATP-binding protein [Geminicoccus flavidas]|uniref:ABC transporter ATP-binding protein n=1 Tax=Geminicoccus flavidas TaxID=2506407 RepID=UPI00135CE471|nr:ABC transporter ATP-binding protein [Geminicoccus flavidas]